MTDQQKAFDSFNDHQKDNRGRATLIVNYALVLAGAAFTASIGVFSSRENALSEMAISHLHSGWFSLFLSTCLLFSFLVAMVLRDYCYAEIIWRPKLYGNEPHLNEKWCKAIKVCFELFLFISGPLGLAALFYGLYKIMAAAMALVG